MISEPLRPKPDRDVLVWLDAQAAETLYLSTVSLAELLLGIESLPAGKRRKALAGALHERVIALFGERIVPISARRKPTRKSSRAPAGMAIR